VFYTGFESRMSSTVILTNYGLRYVDELTKTDALAAVRSRRIHACCSICTPASARPIGMTRPNEICSSAA
jgi:hypothetical protein